MNPQAKTALELKLKQLSTPALYALKQKMREVREVVSHQPLTQELEAIQAELSTRRTDHTSFR